MDEVAQGVYSVGGYVNAYIVDGDQGVVLIDTGLPKRDGPIVDGLARIGRSPTYVIAILLTHAHHDHIGGASYLRNASGAAVVASVADTPAIQGENPTPPPPMLPGWLGWVTRIMPSATSVAVDVRVNEGDQADLPDDFRVLDTPGHTPGHISCLLDRAGGILFVGDAAAARKDGSVVRGFFNGKGSREIDSSIGHLAEQDFDVALFGHSGPISADAAAAFRAFRAF